MAETVNVEDHSREELNTMATDLGLTDASKYPNKLAVADAINRVNGGEDAAAVNAELAGDSPKAQDPDAGTTRSPKTTESAAVSSGKKIHAINGGHPMQFDETGNPVYDPEQV